MGHFCPPGSTDPIESGSSPDPDPQPCFHSFLLHWGICRSTNTQYESPDILGRLDVRLMEIHAGDTGWDVFSLDYKVRHPPPLTGPLCSDHFEGRLVFCMYALRDCCEHRGNYRSTLSPMLRIRDKHPGSRIRIFPSQVPDPGSKRKGTGSLINICNPKNYY